MGGGREELLHPHCALEQHKKNLKAFYQCAHILHARLLLVLDFTCWDDLQDELSGFVTY